MGVVDGEGEGQGEMLAVQLAAEESTVSGAKAEVFFCVGEAVENSVGVGDEGA
jgi:hypothetical protein